MTFGNDFLGLWEEECITALFEEWEGISDKGLFFGIHLPHIYFSHFCQE